MGKPTDCIRNQWGVQENKQIILENPYPAENAQCVLIYCGIYCVYIYIYACSSSYTVGYTMHICIYAPRRVSPLLELPSQEKVLQEVSAERHIYIYMYRRCLFCSLTQNPTHPYEKVGFGEGRFPYESIGFSAIMVTFLRKTQGWIHPGLRVGSLSILLRRNKIETAICILVCSCAYTCTDSNGS